MMGLKLYKLLIYDSWFCLVRGLVIRSVGCKELRTAKGVYGLLNRIPTDPAAVGDGIPSYLCKFRELMDSASGSGY